MTRTRPFRHSVPTLLLVGLLVVGLGADPALAQDGPSGTVTGFVFDSTRSLPLNGATVALWETAFTTTTDAEGQFVLEGVPVGDYTAVFFHPRLQYLGLGSGHAQVSVRTGGENGVVLTTPSMPTILRTQCLLEGTPDGHEVAVGLVSDARSGVPMAGARVTMRWEETGGRAQRIDAEAGPEGWFHACAVPSGARVAVRAYFLNMSSTRQEFSVDGGTTRVDLLLGEYSDARVSGTLRDQLSGEAVRGAEVRLEGTNHFTVSDDQGLFEILDVDPGEYTLAVSHVGYPTRRETVDFNSDLGHHLQIALSANAIELEPIVVTVEQDAIQEQLNMGGHLISSADVDAVRFRSRHLADVLQHQQVPGLQVRRQEGQLCAQFGSGTVRVRRNECEPVMVYIDNARVSDPTVALDMPPEAIDRLVIFRPVEAGALFGTGAARGVIMVYTKTGRRGIR